MDEMQNGSAGTDDQQTANDSPASGGTDETFGWTAPDASHEPAGSDPRPTAERMLGQLQSMIDAVATQAAPVVRQIGVKAAELAAVAADRAGPLAHKAADATEHAGERIAERSRTWAADLRNRAAEPNAAAADAESDSSSSVAIDGADGAVEETARDQPAEGERD